MKTPRSRRNCGKAFTRIELLLILTVLVLIVGVLIPSMIKSRRTAQQNHCINNLRQIDAAKGSWALETKKTADDVPRESELYGYAHYIKDQPFCPAGGVYTLGPVRRRPTCSIAGHILYGPGAKGW
jgi:competence protein ComGC